MKHLSAKKDAKEFLNRKNNDSSDAINTLLNKTSWIDSSKVKQCKKCNSNFTLTKRKHHCRSCGQVFCKKCSSYEIVVKSELKRSCFECFERITLKLENDNNNINYENNNHITKIEEKQISSKQTSNITSEVHTLTKNQAFERSLGKIKSNDSNEINYKNSIIPWSEGFAFISKKNNKHIIDAVYPDNLFSDDMLDSIAYSSIPDSPIKGNRVDQIEFNYMFRSRDTSLELDTNSIFYNCFVLYRQNTIKNEYSNDICQSSLVFISRWPVPHLAFRLLSLLEESFMLHNSFNENNNIILINSNNNSDSDDETSCKAIKSSHIMKDLSNIPLQNLLMVSFSHIMIWDLPAPSKIMTLPFLGEV
jgi:hypothetical protein